MTKYKKLESRFGTKCATLQVQEGNEVEPKFNYWDYNFQKIHSFFK